MIVSAEECDALMERLRNEPDLHLFYAKSHVEFGTIGDPASNQARAPSGRSVHRARH